MNHTEDNVSKELTKIAKQIRDWQVAQQLTDTALLKKFNGLGSTKTFGLILSGKADDLDVERWLVEYRRVQTLIEALSSDISEEEPLYEDLSTCSRLRVAVTDALKERGNARLVIVQGPSGSGKTAGTKALAARFGSKVILSECDETWKESPHNMLGGLLRAFGLKQLPPTTDGRLSKLLEMVNEKDYVLVIDEAHHLGPRTLNLVKTLINKSMTVIVLCAMDTLFRRLEMGAYEEARQLTQNRLCERVMLGNLERKDVEEFLQDRLNWGEGVLDKVIASTVNGAKHRGYFAFLKAAVRLARRRHGQDPLTVEDWAVVLTLCADKR
jgi:Rad3-related DNA helicase